MTRTLPALACLTLVLLAACNREQSAEPASAIAPEPAITVQTDAVAVEPAAAPSDETTTFDVRAFAGTFRAGANRLVLVPDGTYTMTLGDAATDGTWTAEENDTRIRLDPNSKSEPDRVFAIAGRDELTALAPDGRPATGADAMNLRREAD